MLHSHLRLGLPRGLSPVTLPVKILKALIPYSILTTFPAQFNVQYIYVRLIRIIVRYISPHFTLEGGSQQKLTRILT